MNTTSGPCAVFHHALLLTDLELGLLPLQVFWWRQTLQFWNSLAVLPVGSLYHTVCLGNAFQGVACNMASSLAACMHSVGFEMPRVHDVVPLIDVDGVVEALQACRVQVLEFWGCAGSACLQSTGLHACRVQVLAVCIVLVQPPLRVILCTYQQ